MTDLFEAEVTTTTSLDLRRLQRQRRRAVRRKWALVFVSVGLVLLALGGSVAYNFVADALEDDTTLVADYDDAGQGAVQVIIVQGDNGADIATTLYEKGVIASREAYIAASNANPDSAGIQPGYYVLQREMKASYALEALLDPNNRELRTITIPEGLTLDSYYQKIAEATGSTIEDVQKVAEDTEALGLPAEANGNLEGWLFPSTYPFDPGVTPAKALSAMIQETLKQLDSLGVAEADRLRVLTVASLIEREAKLDEDRPMISGVIYNRLDRGMKLQLDATIKYFAPSSGAFTSEEERNTDNPYNTYMYEGLPPGPIAGSGAASLAAAVAPAQHNYLFYVTVNLATGETAYAETFDGHQQNVQKLTKWMAENPTTEE